jgi:hypothetical protein
MTRANANVAILARRVLSEGRRRFHDNDKWKNGTARMGGDRQPLNALFFSTHRMVRQYLLRSYALGDET